MFPFGLPLAGLLYAAIVSTILQMGQSVVGNLAGNLGADVILSDLREALQANALKQEIKQAIERAYAHFVADLHDPALQRVTDRRGGFMTSKTVAALLAQVATRPEAEEEQITELAQLMVPYAPTATPDARAAAAALLVHHVHDAVWAIRRLQLGILRLQGLQLLAVVEKPPYEPRLYEHLLDAARKIARQLDHGYIASAHLLYALTALANGAAPQTLQRLGISAARLEPVLRARIKAQDKNYQLSEHAKQALDQAQQVARGHHDTRTRSEHLLEALADRAIQGQEGSRTLAAVLHDLEIDPHALQQDAALAGQVESQIQSAIESFHG
jgi:hypothetical protein